MHEFIKLLKKRFVFIVINPVFSSIPFITKPTIMAVNRVFLIRRKHRDHSNMALFDWWTFPSIIPMDS